MKSHGVGFNVSYLRYLVLLPAGTLRNMKKTTLQALHLSWTSGCIGKEAIKNLFHNIKYQTFKKPLYHLFNSAAPSFITYIPFKIYANKQRHGILAEYNRYYGALFYVENSTEGIYKLIT